MSKKENKQLAKERREKERLKRQRKNMLINALKFGLPALFIIFLVIIIVCDPFTNKSEVDYTSGTQNNSTNNTTKDNTSADNTYTPEKLDETLTYYADIDIADYGKITVKLDQASAPISAANFVALAEDGFYNGLTFHRIIKDFMMQGGDPKGNGTGGSENNIAGEFSINGYNNNLSHTRGAISMARSSSYNSASSQFFIVHEDSTHLDGQYAVFGYVTDGMDVVDTVCEKAKPTDNNGTIPAKEQPVITSISIRTE